MLIKKKGERGNASNFITRTKAIRKLQLSLADFRRLCILKGIYPREPRNKKKASGNRNSNNTFYFTKDIKFLLHEPIVARFREHRVFLKKLNRALGKDDAYSARVLQDNEPVYTLEHILKERYATFMDAIRDLDDCLCHVFLFATLPSSDKIPLKFVEKSQRLAAEFQNYIIQSKSLVKSFVSIKGIYYQATIRGIPVTWLVPHQFSTPVPHDVDLRVMLTFLEFYHTMMSFVNYKLYSDIQFRYPPALDVEMEENGGWLASFILQSAKDANETSVPTVTVNKKSEKKMKKRIQQLNVAEIVGDQPAEDELEQVDIAVADEEEPVVDETPLLHGLVFFISREVPRMTLEFVLRSMGATVCYPETVGKGSPFPEDSPNITHQIVDRPMDNITAFSKRIYVQPQWAFDSLNAGKLMAVGDYAPGKSLPPHLSPFMDYDATHGQDDTLLQDDEEDVEQIEREAEVSGVAYSEFEKENTSKPAKQVPSAEAKKLSDEAEKVDRAKMVMSNKKRKLLEAIERKSTRASERQKNLASKKQKLRTNSKA